MQPLPNFVFLAMEPRKWIQESPQSPHCHLETPRATTSLSPSSSELWDPHTGAEVPPEPPQPTPGLWDLPSATTGAPGSTRGAVGSPAPDVGHLRDRGHGGTVH